MSSTFNQIRQYFTGPVPVENPLFNREPYSELDPKIGQKQSLRIPGSPHLPFPNAPINLQTIQQHRCLVVEEGQDVTPCSQYRENEGTTEQKTIAVLRRYTSTDIPSIRRIAEQFIDPEVSLAYKQYADWLDKLQENNEDIVAVIVTSNKDERTVKCLGRSNGIGSKILFDCGLDDKTASIFDMRIKKNK